MPDIAGRLVFLCGLTLQAWRRQIDQVSQSLVDGLFLYGTYYGVFSPVGGAA